VAHDPQGPKEVVVVKNVLLIVVVAALALTLVPLAMAGAPGGGGWKHGKATFNLVGSVVAPDVVDPAVEPAVDPAVDPDADPVVVSTITIKVKAGTKTLRVLRGEVADFMAADARVWLLTGDGAVGKTLADIAPGDWVKARGTITKAVDGKGVTSLDYTIKTLKYRDLTPPVEEPTTPPPAE
jgi:hypothetical protein